MVASLAVGALALTVRVRVESSSLSRSHRLEIGCPFAPTAAVGAGGAAGAGGGSTFGGGEPTPHAPASATTASAATVVAPSSTSRAFIVRNPFRQQSRRDYSRAAGPDGRGSRGPAELTVARAPD